ncbi:brefeldin A-inhibited guanine nucleotide-exchange protein [Metschnikowia aff. pulcherrima]|uniref:Brefeldin A-inhibited guanine nucleotide-exchange protein n=1 Tax=Metschnikowia aff. pulcherrima TaxID=2163413 RepID=A0A4P6XIL8_9ASCO|nr:brefeldin A-inhibited guanine nucleotide-exchange protein [Metschnikowia aff. pulcherrima]
MSERRASEDLPLPKGQLAISKENDVDEDAIADSIGDEKLEKSGQNTEELAAENGSGSVNVEEANNGPEASDNEATLHSNAKEKKSSEAPVSEAGNGARKDTEAAVSAVDEVSQKNGTENETTEAGEVAEAAELTEKDSPKLKDRDSTEPGAGAPDSSPKRNGDHVTETPAPESTPIVTTNDDLKTSDTSKPEVPPKETPTANIGVREPLSLAPPSGLSPKRRTSSSATSSAASPRRSTNAKVDNTAIFKKTFEAILQSKELQKNDALKTATLKAIESLDNSASRDPHVLFESLKLACETSSIELKLKAVDLFAKLFDYALFDDEDDRTQITDASVDVIASCLDGEGTDPDLELQVVRALIHSVILMPTHGASLLKAVRLIYNVFIFSLTPRNQAVAQGTLTQVISTIFQRVGEAMSATRASRSSSEINLQVEVPEKTGKMTLEKLQNLSGDSADHARVSEANRASEKDEDLVVKDAFLIFRAMCKLSVKDFETDNIDMRLHSVRLKLLSLHIIHTILRNNIDIFLSRDVVILSSGSDDQTRLIDAVRSYLCQALIRNAASPLAPVFELTLETFWLLISNLRSDFKMEIPVLWEQIYIPVAEMKTSTPHQKRYLLSVIERLCNDSRCIIEFYLNYDCDSSQPNICEKIIDYLTRLSLLRVEVSAAQKAAYQENKGAGISLYDVSKIDNLTTTTMSSKPPEPDVYNLFPLEYSMKIASLNSAVAFLRSLYSWAQKGFLSTQKLRSSLPRVIPSASPLSTGNNSRNPSFVGHQHALAEAEADDPEQFETQKQRKRALVEGAKQFSQKPKKGIAYFIDKGFIKSDTPEDIALFLLNTDTLDKAALGDYLGEGSEKNIAIMHAFVDQMNFEESSFVDSLRTFLQLFRLPGEGQKIDRFMLKFAERYVLGNPKVFSNADAAYVLAYSTVMLNTDQHSRQVKNRMTVENFIMNNSGIDDGKDLPREFLEQVYSEIQSNEIKLQSEHHAALLAGDQALVSSAQSGFFGTRDLNREAYIHASKEMSTKTEKLVKNLGRKMRSEDSPSQVYYAASNVQHVRSIFDTTWMSILAGLTGLFKEYDEAGVIRVCLEGIKLSIKISCMFDLQYAKKSFIGALVQFQNLNNIEDIKAKNVDAIHVMLEIAVSEGNYLQKSWIDVLTSISQLERLQLIAKGIDGDSIPDVTSVRLVNRNSIESNSSTPSGFFSLFTRETSASQSASIKYHNQQLSPESAQLLGRTDLSVAVDKVFTNSSELSGESIRDFVEALSQVATEEIESSGQSSNPRMFSLQKVVDICYYNMSRIRLEWSQLWVTLGDVFNKVGCNSNLAVDFFALDSLRQLSMRFMEIEELAHFKFQKEFLKPFQHIIVHNRSLEVKDMVLECINNMVLAKATCIKSGWKTIFEVLTVAAGEKVDSLVTKAYKLAFTINKEFSEEVIRQDSFADLVSCFTEFAKNEKLQKVGLLSLEVLSRLIVRVAKTLIEIDTKETISAARDASSKKYENLTKLWFPLLYGFHDIIMSGEELEVRSRTLTHFFDVLLKYGSHFETDFWDLIYQKLLAPIFGVIESPWNLRYDEEKAHYGISENDKMSFWVSTTFIQALNGMISLFSHYFEALTPRLQDLLGLLVNCICQENDTIARTGKTCFEEFLFRNGSKFEKEHWDLVIETFERLFSLTTAKELFLLDPLREEENSDVDSLDINDLDKSLSENSKDGTCDKSTIVVKCVLQLLMIETVLELSVKEEFYDVIPDDQLMALGKLLYRSFNFAKKFNDDYDLRVRLWNAGVIERLPNLLKQESMSAAVFLNIMFRLYCDDRKATSSSSKKAIMDSVVPLCYTIVKRFSDLDDVNQQKSIATWRPVITEIFEGFVEMDEADFASHSPELYRLTLGLFDRSMGADLRKALQMFMARVGDVFVK